MERNKTEKRKEEASRFFIPTIHGTSFRGINTTTSVWGWLTYAIVVGLEYGSRERGEKPRTLSSSLSVSLLTWP
jgi:hypothetical protein